MPDFTLSVYQKVLESLQQSGYVLQPFREFKLSSLGRVVVLRHDVDRYPKNALKMAELEASLDIMATYYFRVIPSVFKPNIIIKIADLGHEIGYHYEDLATAKGNFDEAIKNFEINLNTLRQYYPVKTICRHGSPLSRWDSKLLWERNDYHDFGILCDTEYDFDFNEVFYISDNGMGWNKTSTSIRDKVTTAYNIPIKNTFHLIELIKNNELPLKVMLNAHPDTFFDFGIRWIMNFFLIKSKNIVKWIIVKLNIIK